MTNKFNQVLSSLGTLDEEFDGRLIPMVEPEVVEENAYRGAKKCLRVYQLNAMSRKMEQLEKAEKNLRSQLLNYTAEFHKIFSEASTLI